MGVFHRIFRNRSIESVVLIDVGGSAVGGAYVVYRERKAPEMLYARTMPLEMSQNEPRESAMARALGLLGDNLVKEASPLLRRATGSGSVDAILVSVNPPWQGTAVRAERFEDKKQFAFSEAFIDEALKKAGNAPKGSVLADETVIGTLLNGYETRDPYGKRAHRASVVILSSFIDDEIARSLVNGLRGFYHTKNILPIAGVALRYQAMRTIFPHESDVIILDTIGSIAAIAIVRRGLLVTVADAPYDQEKDKNWTDPVLRGFLTLAQRFPLPRTIFLLSREPDAKTLEAALKEERAGSLWLSEAPPKVLAVAPKHVAGDLKLDADVRGDLSLLLAARYWELHKAEGKS